MPQSAFTLCVVLRRLLGNMAWDALSQLEVDVLSVVHPSDCYYAVLTFGSIASGMSADTPLHVRLIVIVHALLRGLSHLHHIY